MDKQLGRPVLLEFWDFCRSNSLRTLPYVRAWHARHAAAGLRVISVHAGAYPVSRDPGEVRAAVARLGIEHPVLLDTDFALWQRVRATRAGPRATSSTATCACTPSTTARASTTRPRPRSPNCSASEAPPFAPVRPEDAPGARLVVPTPEQPGAWSGPYEAGAVWAVLEPVAGTGAPASIARQRRRLAVPHAGCFAVVEHERHSAGRARARDRRRRDLPRRAVHGRPGGLSPRPQSHRQVAPRAFSTAGRTGASDRRACRAPAITGGSTRYSCPTKERSHSLRPQNAA